MEPLEETDETDPALWEHSIENISLIFALGTYRFEIRGTGEGTLNLLAPKSLTYHSHNELYMIR